MSPIRLSPDRLQAILELDGPAIAVEVAEELKAQGVVFGIDQDAINSALVEGAEGTAICIASGTEPTPPKAAYVKLDFELGQTAGTLDSSSLKIDYRERRSFQGVKLDERLGVWFPGVEGIAGTGVDGEPIEPPLSQEVEGSVGDNVHTEPGPEGSLLLFASIPGVIRTGTAGDVYVSDLLEVEGDVDLTVGNIDVSGSVHVRGTVRSGFRVLAGMDVEVDGVVENADIKAGKSLHIGAGILAGTVEARDQITAKYAQNATLTCQGDVTLEVDTNSTIETAGRISASEGAGRLRGGVYVAGVSVTARELGSTQGIPTIIRVGCDPALTRELAKICGELAQIEEKCSAIQLGRSEESDQRKGSALTSEQAENARQSMKSLGELNSSMSILEKRRGEIEEAMSKGGAPFVRVETTVHAGVQMHIGEANSSFDHTRPGGTFRRDAETGEISAS